MRTFEQYINEKQFTRWGKYFFDISKGIITMYDKDKKELDTKEYPSLTAVQMKTMVQNYEDNINESGVDDLAIKGFDMIKKSSLIVKGSGVISGDEIYFEAKNVKGALKLVRSDIQDYLTSNNDDITGFGGGAINNDDYIRDILKNQKAEAYVVVVFKKDVDSKYNKIINEGLKDTYQEISSMTGLNSLFLADWAENNELDIESILAAMKSKKVTHQDIVRAFVSKTKNSTLKNLIKNYSIK
jgi:hypothetical protein